MNNSNLWVTIPTGKRRDYLEDIITSSGVPENQIVIVHTDESKPIDGVNNLWDFDEINIHRWWNRGIKYAKENGAKYIAVLNDDIEIRDNALQKIVAAMDETNAVLAYPYPFEGWVCGYCWVLRIDTDITADEKYRWWYGDRDIDLQAKQKGLVIGVAAKVRHIHGNELTRDNPKLIELTKADEEYFFDKWKDVIKRG